MTIKPKLCDICTRYYSDLYMKIASTIPVNKDFGYTPFKELCKAMKCHAFPDGIPEDILRSKFIHFEKHPLQKNDIVFEFSSSDVPDVLKEIKYLLEDFKEKYKLQKNGKS